MGAPASRSPSFGEARDVRHGGAMLPFVRKYD